MKVRQLLIASVGLVLAIPAIAGSPFSEKRDSYPTGQSMHGVGGSHGWYGNAAATAFTSNAQAQSSPNSIAISPTSDLVHEFSGYNTGQVTVTAWSYVPSSTIGQQYFIMLNTYADGGPYNWSTELLFENGVLTNDGSGATFPLVNDAWTELRIEIDFDADTQTFYYDGNFFDQTSWVDGVSGGGVANLAAMDLFSNGATEVYWDDISIEPAGPTPVQESSWGAIKATFK